jgi:hypothetical protein
MILKTFTIIGLTMFLAGMANAQTTLTSCQVVSKSGTYQIGTDVVNSTPGAPCFDVTASDVSFVDYSNKDGLVQPTITCSGHNQTGIKVEGSADNFAILGNLHVVDCKIGLDLSCAATGMVAGSSDDPITISGDQWCRYGILADDNVTIRVNGTTAPGYDVTCPGGEAVSMEGHWSGGGAASWAGVPPSDND